MESRRTPTITYSSLSSRIHDSSVDATACFGGKMCDEHGKMAIFGARTERYNNKETFLGIFHSSREKLKEFRQEKRISLLYET